VPGSPPGIFRAHARFRKLTIGRIEALAEALLDFHARADLSRWLKSNR